MKAIWDFVKRNKNFIIIGITITGGIWIYKRYFRVPTNRDPGRSDEQNLLQEEKSEKSTEMSTSTNTDLIDYDEIISKETEIVNEYVAELQRIHNELQELELYKLKVPYHTELVEMAISVLNDANDAMERAKNEHEMIISAPQMTSNCEYLDTEARNKTLAARQAFGDVLNAMDETIGGLVASVREHSQTRAQVQQRMSDVMEVYNEITQTKRMVASLSSDTQSIKGWINRNTKKKE